MTNSNNSLFNRNCHAYLSIIMLNMPDSVLKTLSESLQSKLITIKNAPYKYDETVAYGNIYSDFFTQLDANIDQIYDKRVLELNLSIKRSEHLSNVLSESNKNSRIYPLFEKISKPFILPEEKLRIIRSEIEALDDFIDAIYHNDNKVLIDAFEQIKSLTLSQRPKSTPIRKKIAKTISADDEKNHNLITPTQQGSRWGRFTTLISEDFKPQYKTSIATIRQYQYTKDSHRVEYRFGTQGQRHRGKERVSPLFERWLTVQQHKNPQKKITHVYFNNLGLDRHGFKGPNRIDEGKKERKLSLALHQLETRHDNIAVITLPADKGLFNENDYMQTQKILQKDTVKAQFLQIARQEDDTGANIKDDFFISKKIKQLIYQGNKKSLKDNELKVLNNLIDSSFKKLGFEHDVLLSPAQRQAVWFHFTKYELPNFIIEALNPDGFNFSCKDAIDRGGVSSTYYNLMKSIELQKTMSRDEFERGLHAAAAVVKGRGLNGHLKRIWNAVDVYVRANYESLRNDEKRAWLVEWRDANCPHVRVDGLLKERVAHGLRELGQEKDSKKKSKGLAILTEVANQSSENVSGKRLLLEVATKTPSLVMKTKPSKTDLDSYQSLAQEIPVKYPSLTLIGGLMKALLGLILYVPSLSKSSVLINSGVSSMKSAFFAKQRQEIADNMQSLSDGYIETSKPSKIIYTCR
jgi:hypothetical protein